MTDKHITDESVFRFFAEANPVPATTARIEADRSHQAGRNDMTQQDTKAHPSGLQHRTRWIAGLAAAAVILILIGIPAIYLMVRNDSSTVADAENGDAEAVGLLVAEAIYAGDAEQVARWLDPAFGSTPGTFYSSPEELVNLAAFYGAGADPRAISITCEVAGFGDLVNCPVVPADPELVLPDDVANDFVVLTVVDGLVVGAEPHWDTAWIIRLAGIAQSVDPSGFEQACAPQPDARTFAAHQVTFNGDCGAFLADYTDALTAALKG